MRLLFFILLLANCGVLAYFILPPGTEGRAAAHAPLRADAIRIPAEAHGQASAPAVKTACLEWSGLNDAALARARDALEQLGIKDKLVFSNATDQWIYIPPLQSRADADKKLAELRRLGIEDGKVIEDDPKWRFAISLAAFPSGEEAQFYLKQLHDQGVRNAKLLERPAPSTSITIVDVDDALRDKLEKLHADFDQTTLKPVACKSR